MATKPAKKTDAKKASVVKRPARPARPAPLPDAAPVVCGRVALDHDGAVSQYGEIVSYDTADGATAACVRWDDQDVVSGPIPVTELRVV